MACHSSSCRHSRAHQVRAPALALPAFDAAVKALDLPGIALEDGGEESLPDGRRYRLNVVLPFDTPLLQFAIPLDAGLRRVWVDGELALDTSLRTKRTRRVHTLRLVNPPRGSMALELETAASDPFTV